MSRDDETRCRRAKGASTDEPPAMRRRRRQGPACSGTSWGGVRLATTGIGQTGVGDQTPSGKRCGTDEERAELGASRSPALRERPSVVVVPLDTESRPRPRRSGKAPQRTTMTTAVKRFAHPFTSSSMERIAANDASLVLQSGAAQRAGCRKERCRRVSDGAFPPPRSSISALPGRPHYARRAGEKT